MITRIEVDGFKTFQSFEMDFDPVTVIAGQNASGKSNLFDALSLLSRLADTDLRTAFGTPRGTPSELFTQFDNEHYAPTMHFAVEVLVNKNVVDNWGGSDTLRYTRLRYELELKREQKNNGLEDLLVQSERLVKCKHDDDNWIERIPSKARTYWRPLVVTGKRGAPYIETSNNAIILRQDGTGGKKREYPLNARITQTVLSSIKSVDFKHAFAVKEELKSWKFLQLNPDALRKPTSQEIGMSDTISHSGENLAAALWRIQQQDGHALGDISRTLNRLLPSLVGVSVSNDQANRQFLIKIRGEDGREFSSRVLSEGTLRLLALAIFQQDDKHQGLLCFEEPENGVHPARLKEMARLLMDLSVDFSDENDTLRQVIINTHSPILVNELFELKKDRNVSVWLSQLVTRVVSREGHRTSIQVSKLAPVIPNS